MREARIAALAVLLAASLYGTASAQTLDSLASDTPGPDPARDAYLDETARQLMLGLRAARDTARLTIDSYTALVRERLGAEVPTLRRNRPFMHGERTVRVRWSRDEPAVVHVLGARSRTPLFDPGDSEFFAGLRTERFGADPLGDPFTFGFSVFEFPQTATRSPLEPGSERYYRISRSAPNILTRAPSHPIRLRIAPSSPTVWSTGRSTACFPALDWTSRR